MNQYKVSHDICVKGASGKCRKSKIRYYGSINGNILLEDLCRELTTKDPNFEGIKVFYLPNNKVRISMYNHMCIGSMVTAYLSYGDYRRLEYETTMSLKYKYSNRASLSNMSETANIIVNNVYSM